MSLSPGLRTQLQAVLVDAFSTLAELDQLVQEAFTSPARASPLAAAWMRWWTIY